MLGYYFDQKSDSYYVRVRHFDAVLGRWTSQDPLGYSGSKRNLYEYASSCPLRYTDPSGELQTTPWLVGVCGLGGRINPATGAVLTGVGIGTACANTQFVKRWYERPLTDVLTDIYMPAQKQIHSQAGRSPAG